MTLREKRFYNAEKAGYLDGLQGIRRNVSMCSKQERYDYGYGYLTGMTERESFLEGFKKGTESIAEAIESNYALS